MINSLGHDGDGALGSSHLDSGLQIRLYISHIWKATTSHTRPKMESLVKNRRLLSITIPTIILESNLNRVPRVAKSTKPVIEHGVRG